MTGLAAKVGAGASMSALQAFFGKIPVWMRWTLLGLLIAAAGFVWHQHAAHKAIAAAEKRGADAAYANMASQAVALKVKADALNTSLAQAIREKNDEESRRIAADADALRVSGPGKAVCRSPGLAGGPSGYVEAGGSRAAAVDTLSDSQGIDLIGLPFAGAVAGAEQADLNRAEVIAWREWWTRFDVQWKAYQQDADKARKP
jgi:hypothetical protein